MKKVLKAKKKMRHKFTVKRAKNSPNSSLWYKSKNSRVALWFVEDKRKCISDFLFFLLELSLCYKRLDHGGDTVDMPLSQILFKNPEPINL